MVPMIRQSSTIFSIASRPARRAPHIRRDRGDTWAGSVKLVWLRTGTVAAGTAKIVPAGMTACEDGRGWYDRDDYDSPRYGVRGGVQRLHFSSKGVARPQMRSIGREFDSSYSCLMADKSFRKGSAPKFGGPWTIMKIEMVAAYLKAFTTLLFNKPSPSRPFKRIYIDGFAGSGSFKFGARSGLIRLFPARFL
jgi:hypothetical protein